MRIRRLLLFVLTIAFSAAAQPAGDLWRQQSIYQIFTDRFYDGDPSNDNADGNYNPRRARSPHGGDFRGVEEKLDYVKALGATAIWISPIILNGHGEYHGYAGKDFYKVDPRWGSEDDLRHMAAAAHARGLLVIDDIVVNHGADLINSADPGYGRFRPPPAGYELRYRNPTNTYPPPFNLCSERPALSNLFHNNGVMQNADDRTQAVYGELAGLDDFRTESPYVREQMKQIYKHWIEAVGFDGFRVDTVKHVEMSFWQEWCPAMRAFAAAHGKPDFFMFGEVYGWDDALCGSYTGREAGGAPAMDSVLDYPLYFAVNNVFAHASAPTAELGRRYDSLATHYDPAARNRLVTFLDNHDQPRFLSRKLASNDTARLKTALVFLYTSVGIPCLYYGTEQAFNGETDPYDREDMFAGQLKDGPTGVDSFNETHPLFLWIARLNEFRRDYPELELGEQVNMFSDSHGPGLFAYARRWNGAEALVVLNTALAPQTLPEQPTLWPPGTPLLNLMATNEVLTVTDSGRVPPVTLPAMSAKIFTAQSQWRAPDPMVIQTDPAHDAIETAGAATIALEFSEPMDTKTVEHAFNSTPPTRGTFAWSPARDRVTFTAEEGFSPGSIIQIRVESSASGAASERTLHAPFEMRFRTRGARP